MLFNCLRTAGLVWGWLLVARMVRLGDTSRKCNRKILFQRWFRSTSIWEDEFWRWKLNRESFRGVGYWITNARMKYNRTRAIAICQLSRHHYTRHRYHPIFYPRNLRKITHISWIACSMYKIGCPNGLICAPINMGEEKKQHFFSSLCVCLGCMYCVCVPWMPRHCHLVYIHNNGAFIKLSNL